MVRSPAGSADLLLRNLTLIDGTRRGPQSGLDVLVRGGRVAAIGRALHPPDGAISADLAGATCLPGLIDCHVHFSLGAGPSEEQDVRDPIEIVAMRAARFVEQTLDAGFTTVRDIASREALNIHLRDAVERGIIRGPRILACGLHLCITGGHGWEFGRECDGADGTRAAVREQVKRGADVIKFMASGGVMTPGGPPKAPQFSLEELGAGVEEAHKAGRRAAAHAHAADAIRNAVMAGIDSIEHGTFITDDLIEEMRRRGTFLVPTFAAIDQLVRHAEDGGMPGYVVERALEAAAAHRDAMQRCIRAGVRIAMGTDAGSPFNLHGENAQELRLMVEAGMGPLDALRASTVDAAELCGLDRELGTVEVGKRADLLVVDGDPLLDIGLLRDRDRFVLLLRDGRVVRRSPHVVLD